MTFVHARPAINVVRPLSIWRSAVQSALALVDGDVATRRQTTQGDTEFPIGTGHGDLLAPELIQDRAVFVVDFSDGTLCDTVKTVATGAETVRRVGDIETAINLVLSRSAGDVLVIVNIDTLDDMDDAVEGLLALKLVGPDVPVLMCSTTFSKNNFSRERRAITDASLRLPCSGTGLAMAIAASVTNSQR